MKKILFFTHHLSGGGAEKAMAGISSYLARHCTGEISVAIAVVYDDETVRKKLSELGITVHILGNGSQPGDSRLKKIFNAMRHLAVLRSIKKKTGTDVCVSFLSGANFLNALSGRGERRIVGVRSIESHYIKNAFQRFYVGYPFRAADTVVAVSGVSARDVTDYFGIPGDKVKAIPNAASMPAEAEGADRGFLDFAAGKRLIIQVARLSPEKGQAHLIKAFAGVARSHEDVCLAIVGEGPEREKLSRLIDGEGLGTRVMLTGKKTAPGDYMKHAEMFILSSEAEGMPNTILEAMLCGLPVISTDCGAREILAPDTDPCYVTSSLEQAQYGVLVPVGDEKLMETAMCGLLDDEGLRSGYARKGSAYVRERYSEDEIMKQWLSILR